MQSIFMERISNIPEQSGNDTPRPQLVISGDNDYITTVAYFPDGRVVTGSRSGAVRVWNSQSGEQEGMMSMEHKNNITDLAVTRRDGPKIICARCDGEIKVWDIESHQLVKVWSHQEWDPVIAISPDDQLIAVGGRIVGIYTTEGERVNLHQG